MSFYVFIWIFLDLILAAELGKALLDRNRKLELALEKSKSIEQEKDAEIEVSFNLIYSS